MLSSNALHRLVTQTGLVLYQTNLVMFTVGFLSKFIYLNHCLLLVIIITSDTHGHIYHFPRYCTLVTLLAI